MIYHDIPVRQWEVIGRDTFILSNKHSIVDYHSKFIVIKNTEDLSADSLILKGKTYL